MAKDIFVIEEDHREHDNDNENDEGNGERHRAMNPSRNAEYLDS